MSPLEFMQPLAALVPRYACREYIDSLAALDFSDAKPRFDAVNPKLGRATGWQSVAVPGLVPDRVYCTAGSRASGEAGTCGQGLEEPFTEELHLGQPHSACDVVEAVAGNARPLAAEG